MPDYAQKLVDRFKADSGKKTLTFRQSPGQLPHLQHLIETDDVGVFAASSATHIGGLLYLARATCGDLLFATSFLSRYTTKWTSWCDRLLTQLFGFLEMTLDLKLVNCFESGFDPTKLKLQSMCDADHGGCPTSARSTTGAVTRILTGNSVATLSWLSQRQKRTSHSTGEAEMVATNDCLRRQTLPLLGLLQAVFGIEPDTDLLSDSRQSQRILLSWLHDVVEEVGIAIGKVHTDDNVSDVLTKHLQAPRFTKLARLLGIM